MDRIVRTLLFIALGASTLDAGPITRVANTTLRFPASPASNTTVNYSTRDALNGLTFASPVALATVPGDPNRLFVVERPGRIIVINNPANPTRTVFLDITDRVYSDYYQAGSEGLSAVVFHPSYGQNGYFYVVYSVLTRTSQGIGPHIRLSRFQVSPSDPNLALPSSELKIITQRHAGYGHDWNDLKFGHDGYLYVAMGDEGDPNDIYHNSQRIDKNFFSAIMRLDVDHRPGSLPPNTHPAINLPVSYSVPPDNPFIGATSFDGQPVDLSQVRTELYAVGLRNPWRMSFDPATGALYAGDVGEHASEEIDEIVKGGNYGWAYVEGTQPGFKGAAPAGVTFIPPLIEYRHGFGQNQGNCVIGGVVYRGRSIPFLNGTYVFADYVSGNIWGTHFNTGSAAPLQYLTADPGIAGFGIDPSNGDILMANHDQGKVKRLVVESSASDSAIPLTLADTGAFKALDTLTPQDGIVPYDVNVPFWSDGASKQRWFSVPQNQTIGFRPDGNWSLPSGTIWIKHFGLEMNTGDPSSRRRIETRFLVKTDSGIYGLTYRWDDSQRNASLVPASGADAVFQITDHGQTRSQTWHFPSRNECLSCHTSVAGYALGFNTPQLNRAFDYPGGTANQLSALKDAGFFNNPPPFIHPLLSLAKADDSNTSAEFRVRSYLAANCAQCHQPGGPGQGSWDARISQPLSASGIVNGHVVNNNGDANARVVVPGDTSHSVLLSRIANLGQGHMPPLSTTVINQEAVNLVQNWIVAQLPRYQTFADWQIQYFGSTDNPDAQPQADPDHDGAVNFLEYLTHRNPRDGSDAWKISVRLQNNQVQIAFPQVAGRWFQVQSTSNLRNPNSWQPLDLPDNHPLISATDRTAVVLDPISGNRPRFYRVQVLEP